MFSENQKRMSGILSNKLQEIGIPMLVRHDQATEKFVSIGHIEVDTSKIGLMGPVFKEIDLEVLVGYNDEWNVAEILLKYHWEHGRGSNGYTARFEYRDEEWKQTT